MTRTATAKKKYREEHPWPKMEKKITFKTLLNVVSGAMRSVNTDHPGAISEQYFHSVKKRIVHTLAGQLIVNEKLRKNND